MEKRRWLFEIHPLYTVISSQHAYSIYMRTLFLQTSHFVADDRSKYYRCSSPQSKKGHTRTDPYKVAWIKLLKIRGRCRKEMPHRIRLVSNLHDVTIEWKRTKERRGAANPNSPLWIQKHHCIKVSSSSVTVAQPEVHHVELFSALLWEVSGFSERLGFEWAFLLSGACWFLTWVCLVNPLSEHRSALSLMHGGGI